MSRIASLLIFPGIMFFVRVRRECGACAEGVFNT